MDQDLRDMIVEMYNDEDPELKFVVYGSWIDDGKYAFKECIVGYKDKYYKIEQSRSGSYYSDYYYEDPEVIEVTKRVEMVETTFWDVVKD